MTNFTAAPAEAGWTKEVGYAYPTSDNAIEAGFAKTGCYVVRLHDPADAVRGNYRSRKRWGFATREEARAFADTLPQAYGCGTL